MSTSPWSTLLDRCGNATEAVIVAPFIKVDALTKVLGQLYGEASLTCITRWTPLDIQVGASDLTCRKLVTDRGGSFRLHNRLHAKYYRFDNRVLVGSANLTASGLSYAHVGNLEVLCEPGPPFDQQSFEAGLRRESREVTDGEFLLWEACPVSERPITLAIPDPVGSTLDDWKPQTRNPEYLWLSYCGNQSQIVSDEQRTLSELDLAILKVPTGLTLEAFNIWIWSSLQASRFADAVQHVGQTNDALAWDTVATDWSVTRSTAARWVSTTQNWLRYFDPTP